MAASQSFEEPGGGMLRRLLVYGVVALVVLAIGYWIYTQATAVRGVAVEAPPPTVIDMLPPPPPPPPPPPEPETKPPEPTETAEPVPSPAPTPAPDAPAPMTQNAPAQAGSDSFGLQAGSGGGMGAPAATGTCITNCGVGSGGLSDGFYRRYLSSALQEKIQENDKVNRLVFTADFAITIAPGGRVTGVELLRSSGKADRDALLKSILESVRGLDPPPASVRFPQKVTVRGRRSL